MEDKKQNIAFCPDIIFHRLNNYITQVQLLDNIQVSNPRKISSQTLGLISISEILGQKNISIIKHDLTLYRAKKTIDWIIIENKLNDSQILAIQNLPQTKEQIFLEFYCRKLTRRLKELFRQKKYPIEQSISLNHAQDPYDFYISNDSTINKLVFVGTNPENDDVVFKSSYYTNNQVIVIKNILPLELVNQLSC